MSSIILQFFAKCPKCNVHTGVIPKEPRNIVITAYVTEVNFIVKCQNCGSKIKIKNRWIVECAEVIE